MADVRTPLLEDRALLPAPVVVVVDHPIFLRVCHSPWPCITQTVLVYLRAFVVAYLTALGIMLLDYNLDGQEDAHTAWSIVFQFPTLAFVLLWIYHIIAFSWTFTHLYYPDVDQEDRRWEYMVLRLMSPPFQTLRSRNRLYFSLFYTAVHVFVFTNALLYWGVAVPLGHGHFPGGSDPAIWATNGDLFGDGWFAPFCIINLYGVTAFIAFLEITIFNSIKRQVPVPTHVFALMFLLSSYLGFAAFGKLLTGHSPFFWLDPDFAGRTEILAAYCAAFTLLGPTVFAFMYGLIGMRENIARRDDHAPPFNPEQFAREVARDVARDVRQELDRQTGA
ncbi:hypothetical protein QBC46DRAFT_358152 [Diplogelasinospora grovesii]|uniref:Uncharacterized protein n=1 Tax=Diplogelasinospora grovesii TaxID=303347 RepID=A0AAN6S0R7_9PEZI|nr:hypothetical protein QBC46DRAFT_358152 [Diplogelasinospora grovesii]